MPCRCTASRIWTCRPLRRESGPRSRRRGARRGPSEGADVIAAPASTYGAHRCPRRLTVSERHGITCFTLEAADLFLGKVIGFVGLDNVAGVRVVRQTVPSTTTPAQFSSHASPLNQH